MKKIAIVSLVIGIIILLGYLSLLSLNGYINPSSHFSIENASKMAPFVSAFVGTFFSLAGTLLILENLQTTTTNNSNNQLLSQKSQFESIFFNLLTQQRQIRDNISSTVYSHVEEKEIETSGANFFDDLATYITIEFENKTQSREELVKWYSEVYHIYNSDLGHYFRHLYHIIKFVTDNPFFELVKDRQDYFKAENYIKILRAQLSNSELTLLSLNCLTKYGEAFYPFVEKYQLLKNINFETELPDNIQRRVPCPEILRESYPSLSTN